MQQALAIRHVAFEDVGSLGPVLDSAGFSLRYLEAGYDDLTAIDAVAPELLIVLGGPIGAYEEHLYPFLSDELRILERRLKADRPTLGFCLGAQLIAKALGSRVYPGRRKEIGWIPLTLTAEGRASPLAHLAPDKTSMLHWHGDTFDLPAGATLLASTPDCDNQALSLGRNVLAFQCHPEATVRGLERWFIGHACEIANTPGVEVPQLRADTALHGPRLERQGALCLSEWLAQIV